MNNPMDLSGKVCLVTGATGSLGRQTCITLSQLGARVVLVARNETEILKIRDLLEGDGHKCYKLDLNKMEEIESLIEKIVLENGKLDGFVHCAGVAWMRTLSATTYDFMQEMMRINVMSFIEVTRILTKKRNCNEGMSIVGVSSAASIRGNKAKTAYCTSKGAMDSAILALAIELGEKKKIRVNTVNPAWIRTSLYDEYIELVGEVEKEKIGQRQFLGVAEPEDISNVIAFLLSPAARQITGQSIVVDGGYIIN